MKTLFRSLVVIAFLTISPLSKAGTYNDFFKALQFDNPQEVQQLIARGVDPNWPNEKGVPALIVALQSNAPNCALYLAKLEATQVNVVSAAGETPLMLAALNNQLDVAQVLIDRGAEINFKGWTPLHYAATHGHVAMIHLLLDNSAYIDAEAPNGNTPLIMATQFGSPQSVKVLLEEGADPTLRNNANISALDISEHFEFKQSAFYLRAFLEAWELQERSTAAAADDE